MERIVKRAALVALLPVILVACGSGDSSTSLAALETAAVAKPSASRKNDFAQVNRGSKLFQANCAECHGKSAEGAPNWRQRNAEGKYPAPPLNGTGHAWHHPHKMLAQVIKNGSPGGQGDMPAWKDKLSEQEIADVMAWFISRWPDEIYDAWQRMDKKSG